MISLKLAVRTIKMYLKRYALLCVVFFVSTLALIINFIGADALKTSMEDACIRIFTGNVMVKHEEYNFRLGFATSGSIDVVEDIDQLIHEYEKQEEVLGCVPRIRRGVQVSAEKTEYMNLIGVDIEREKQYSEFGVTQGKDDLKKGETLISQTFLERLNLSIGDKIFISTVATNGMPIRNEFEIVGVLNNKNMNFLRQDAIMVSYQDAEELLQQENVATELLIFTKNKVVSDETLQKLNAICDQKEVKTYHWKDMGSEIVYASLGSYASILFLALACAVIICALVYNLTSMSIFYQMKSIGTMLAMGMTHGNILVKFIMENLLISMMSCGCGALLSILQIKIISTMQIPMGTAAEIFGNEFLAVQLDYRLIFEVAIGVALLSVISTLIAFNKIRRIQPIEAIVQ